MAGAGDKRGARGKAAGAGAKPKAGAGPGAKPAKGANRAAVFVFYDRDGIADAYVEYFLRELSQNVSRVVVVANGALGDEARAMFGRYAAEGDIIVRENQGFDAWAYRAGIFQIGRAAASACDELVICNDTVFGPVYPFADVFGEMRRRKLDFWGLTKHDAYTEEDLVTRNNPYGFAPAHIQSYFAVFRKRLLASDAFWNFWERLLPIEKYEEAVGKFETVMTKSFEDAGFAWDAFVKVGDIATDDPNFTLYCPADMLEKYRMPVLKCRVFKQDTLTLNAGEQPRKAFEYVRDRTGYDADMILASLIRRFDQYDIVKSLALTYVLPDDAICGTAAGGVGAGAQAAGGQKPAKAQAGRRAAGAAAKAPAPLRVALFMHIYYPHMAADAAALAANMPDGADIHATTDTKEKASAIKRAFKQAGVALAGVRLVENRGRSESALIVGMRDVVGSYDVVCFWKEKVSKQVDYHASMSWAYKIDQNLLGTRAYVENVVALFAANPRLGTLAVTEPFHAVYHWVPGNEWAADFDITKGLAARLGLHVPMKEGSPPVTSFGGAFWFRTAALRKLFDHPWSYDDFPAEPLPIDKTLLHAIERVYPFVAQDAGYYPAFVLNARYAGLEATNLANVLQGYVKAALYHGHDLKTHLQAIEYIYDLNARPVRAKAKRAFRRRLPKPLYYAILGSKRVILGPGRKDALGEIWFRLFRKQVLRRLGKR